MTVPEKTGSRTTLLLVIGVGIFVVAAGAIALLAGGDDASTGSGSTDGPESTAGTESTEGTAGVSEETGVGETGAVTVSGDPLPSMPQDVRIGEDGTDPAVGQIAPSISASDFAGEAVSIEPDGTPKVVLFFAHWCPHCQREMPLVTGLINEGAAPADLEIYGVSTAVVSDRENFPPSAWFEAESWPATSVRDSADNEILLAYGAGGFPYVVYLDGDNRVVARSAGELDAATIQRLWLATAGG